MNAKMPATVAVLGHYGQWNLGDEAITAAAIAGIRRVRPGARVVGISLNPADTRARHGIESYPLRPGRHGPPRRPPRPGAPAREPGIGQRLRRLARRVPGLRPLYRLPFVLAACARAVLAEIAILRQQWRALDDIDVVIVAGSNQIMDNFGAAWGFPYTLLKWSLLTRLRGGKFVLLSVGAGPLDGWLSKRFVLWMLKRAHYVSVRDPGSARLLREMRWRGQVPVMPDLAFGLEIEPPAALRAGPAGVASEGSLTVGINLMPVHDERFWPRSDPAIGARWLAAMAGFVRHVAAAGHRVVLFGMQPSDEWITEELMEDFPLPGDLQERVTLVRVRTLNELAELYRSCDAIAATRFHGILLALRFARPVLGICYFRKSRELLDGFGLGRFAVDLPEVSVEGLAGMFEELVRDRRAIERSITEQLASRTRTLAAQYAEVLGEAEALGPTHRKDAA